MQHSDIGPLQALLDELMFNNKKNNSNEIGCPFETKQFDRVLSEGYLSILHDDLFDSLMEIYRKGSRSNVSENSLQNRF